MKQARVLAPTGVLGFGFNLDSLRRGIDLRPHVIACDGGSTDSGPFHLGSGKPKMSRQALLRDFSALLDAREELGVPLIIGSCGTSGVDAGVNMMRELALELVNQKRQRVRLAMIYGEPDREYLKAKLRAGRIRPLKPAPPVDEQVLDRCAHIVGMMGQEPISAALKVGADIVLAARATDTALFAAVPLMMGLPAGPVWHCAKTIECGAACAAVGRADGVFAWIDETGFEVEPLALDNRCTPYGIAAHTLYENADPYHICEPSGISDTSNARYSAVNDRRVRVTGSEFVEARQHTIKLEGAHLLGFQTVAIGGVRDPFILRQLESWFAGMRENIVARARELFGDRIDERDLDVDLRAYGKDAVMGSCEPLAHQPGHEVGVLIVITAPDQEMATDICKMAAHVASHYPIPEWEGLISGIAYPFSPPEMARGAVYEFALNHVVEVDDPSEMFRMELVNC